MDDQPRRFRTIVNALDIAAICSTFDGWFFASDVHTVFRSEIADACRRTVNRYLFILSDIGILESKDCLVVKNEEGGAWARYQFRWVGWPKSHTKRKTEITPNPFSKRKAK